MPKGHDRISKGQDKKSAIKDGGRLLSAAERAAEEWLEENRGTIEEGGTGDLADLIRRIVLKAQEAKYCGPQSK